MTRIIYKNPAQRDLHEGAAAPRRTLLLRGAVALALVGAYLGLSSTFAANVSLGSSNGLEFGQGVQVTTACTNGTPITITPNSTFTNAAGAGAYKFSSATFSNIPSSCYGVDFILSAYDSQTSSSALPLFNTSKSDAYIYNNAGTFVTGIWANGLSITSHSTSSFTVNFSAPVALSTSVYRLTLQSAPHQAVTCQTGGTCSLGDVGPGGGYVYALSTGSGAGKNYEFARTPLQNGGASYSGLGNIGFNWCNITNAAISGSLGSAVGTGKQNTIDMVAGCTSGAGVAAANYRGGGYSDWFLPSRSELQAFYATLRPILQAQGFGGTERIWSSTQVISGNSDAYFIGLDGYSNAADGKGGNYPVIPIRSWTP